MGRIRHKFIKFCQKVPHGILGWRVPLKIWCGNSIMWKFNFGTCLPKSTLRPSHKVISKVVISLWFLITRWLDYLTTPIIPLTTHIEWYEHWIFNEHCDLFTSKSQPKEFWKWHISYQMMTLLWNWVLARHSFQFLQIVVSILVLLPNISVSSSYRDSKDDC
jgi:hypothetical protein